MQSASRYRIIIATRRGRSSLVQPELFSMCCRNVGAKGSLPRYLDVKNLKGDLGKLSDRKRGALGRHTRRPSVIKLEETLMFKHPVGVRRIYSK